MPDPNDSHERMAVNKPHEQTFHEAGAIRGGWSVRPLDRRISTQFFERILPMA
jgi:predicted nuclease of restriction endonuclease-like (RecB) superfamily